MYLYLNLHLYMFMYMYMYMYMCSVEMQTTHTTFEVLYMSSCIVTDTTTFELELCVQTGHSRCTFTATWCV